MWSLKSELNEKASGLERMSRSFPRFSYVSMTVATHSLSLGSGARTSGKEQALLAHLFV